MGKVQLWNVTNALNECSKMTAAKNDEKQTQVGVPPKSFNLVFVCRKEYNLIFFPYSPFKIPAIFFLGEAIVFI